ncbi:uncharacterized protein FIBRA_00706 [Fibroporia radiculosa]|uniref:Copper transport protein n=1 Tax=Fibroporia radiculosa TaxID=599839 RepID=J4HS20_9APHY|nr:uncharacterized protein FIBRA_00706 [Fibroporia radiculosa]CCL98702.1 predicted protein [Fibroporia radiculosa]
MSHGDHSGHDMPDMPMPMCSMNMLWNTQIEDTCIVFPGWHIQTKTAFVFSFFAVMALGILYEWLRVAQRDVDRIIARRLIADGKGKTRLPRSGRATPESDSEGAGLLSGVSVLKSQPGTPLPLSARVARAVMYGLTVFLSFFLMLVFMTYNAYLILAVVVGAAAGHFIFGSRMDLNSALSGAVDGRGMACH